MRSPGTFSACSMVGIEVATTCTSRIAMNMPRHIMAKPAESAGPGVLAVMADRRRSADAVEVFDLRAAAEHRGELRSGGLEIDRPAVMRQRVLVLVELEHLVGVGLGAALGQLIGQVARLVGADLLGELGEEGLELGPLALLDPQCRDHPDAHAVLRTIV